MKGAVWRRRIRLLSALAIVLATAYIAIDSSSLDTRPDWLPEPTQTKVIVAAIIVGLAAGFNLLEAMRREQRIATRDSLSGGLFDVAFPLWYKSSVLMTRESARRKFGVHIWLVPRWHWTLIPRIIRRYTPRDVRARLRTPIMWHALEIRMDKLSHAATGIGWRR